MRWKASVGSVVDEQDSGAVTGKPSQSGATPAIALDLLGPDEIGRDDEASGADVLAKAGRTPALRVAKREAAGWVGERLAVVLVAAGQANEKQQ